jgi:phage terminase small subunit
MGLSKKQARFCEEFVVDLNATQASIRAGYSKTSAYSIGNENLKKPEVQAKIAELQKKVSESVELSASKILFELSRIAFSDIANYVTFGRGRVSIKDSKGLTKEQTACIQEISKTTSKGGNTIKFALYDKLRALEMLCRHLGLFTDKFQINGMLSALSDEQVEELFNKIIHQLTNKENGNIKSSK